MTVLVLMSIFVLFMATGMLYMGFTEKFQNESPAFVTIAIAFCVSLICIAGAHIHNFIWR